MVHFELEKHEDLTILCEFQFYDPNGFEAGSYPTLLKEKEIRAALNVNYASAIYGYDPSSLVISNTTQSYPRQQENKRQSGDFVISYLMSALQKSPSYFLDGTSESRDSEVREAIAKVVADSVTLSQDDKRKFRLAITNPIFLPDGERIEVFLEKIKKTLTSAAPLNTYSLDDFKRQLYIILTNCEELSDIKERFDYLVTFSEDPRLLLEKFVLKLLLEGQSSEEGLGEIPSFISMMGGNNLDDVTAYRLVKIRTLSDTSFNPPFKTTHGHSAESGASTDYLAKEYDLEVATAASSAISIEGDQHFLLEHSKEVLRLLGYPLENVITNVNVGEFLDAEIYDRTTLSQAIANVMAEGDKKDKLILFKVNAETKSFSSRDGENNHFVALHFYYDSDGLRITYIDPTGAPISPQIREVINFTIAGRHSIIEAGLSLQYTNPTTENGFYEMRGNDKDCGALVALTADMIRRNDGNKTSDLNLDEARSRRLGRLLRALVNKEKSLEDIGDELTTILSTQAKDKEFALDEDLGQPRIPKEIIKRIIKIKEEVEFDLDHCHVIGDGLKIYHFYCADEALDAFDAATRAKFHDSLEGTKDTLDIKRLDEKVCEIRIDDSARILGTIHEVTGEDWKTINIIYFDSPIAKAHGPGGKGNSAAFDALVERLNKNCETAPKPSLILREASQLKDPLTLSSLTQ